MNDRELLIACQTSPDPALFSQIVQRHLDFVYSVALRHLKTPHDAQDITQEVFIALFKKLPALDPQITLAAWLFGATRLAAIERVRADARRHRREQEAAMSHDAEASPDHAWSLIAGEIDAVVDRLEPPERDAILLRFFAGKSHHEIAGELAISEPAARKRVQRGLDSLRDLFNARGIAISAAALAAALASSHTTRAAPLSVLHSIAHATSQPALAAGAKSSVPWSIKGAIMTSAKLKAAAAIAFVVAVFLPATILALQNSRTPPAPPPKPAPPPQEFTPEQIELAFHKTYDLAPDEIIKHIPPPFAPWRTRALEALSRAGATPGGDFVPSPDAAKPIAHPADAAPPAVLLGARLPQPPQVRGVIRTGEGYQVKSLAYSMLYLDPREIEGDPELLNTTIPGDFVIKGVAPGELRAALEKFLSTKLQQPISLKFEETEVPGYTLTGAWHYQPLPGDAATNPPVIHLFAKDRTKLTGNGSIPIGSIARMFVQQLHVEVKVEATGMPPLINYRNYDPPRNDDDRKLLRDHFTQQTGLKWVEKNQTVRHLFITKAQ